MGKRKYAHISEYEAIILSMRRSISMGLAVFSRTPASGMRGGM